MAADAVVADGLGEGLDVAAEGDAAEAEAATGRAPDGDSPGTCPGTCAGAGLDGVPGTPLRPVAA
ncbi:hypothetical protein Q0Z83_026450 [Actinoplanes sichuanensis]|nr:hypothetical protein Q0Z83_026450 [Actinoplanes sichuanensis]